MKSAKSRSKEKVATINADPLVKAAMQVAKNAYSPYSGFAVGAAIETRDGRIFSGVNMENASYGLTMCAEVGALQAATGAGELKNLRRIAVVGGHSRPGPASIPKPTPPCGRCRQLIAEAAQVSRFDIEVLFSDLNGERVERRRISELLPDAFDSSTLR